MGEKVLWSGRLREMEKASILDLTLEVLYQGSSWKERSHNSTKMREARPDLSLRKKVERIGREYDT